MSEEAKRSPKESSTENGKFTLFDWFYLNICIFVVVRKIMISSLHLYAVKNEENMV